jgi:hypothetical protein
LPSAVEASAARDGERHDHAVAFADLAGIHVRTKFFDNAHRFVAEDVAGLHEGDEAINKVQVGTADSGGRDADDGVAAVEERRVRNVFDPYLVRGTPNEGFHDNSLPCKGNM